MSLKMFLEFPGILILIGVVLLIIAIIIGIIAFRKVDENEMTNIVDRKISDDEQPEEIGTDMEEYENNLEEIKEEELPVIKENVIEEAKIEENDEIKEDEEEYEQPEEIIELKDESKDLITEEFEFEEKEQIKKENNNEDDIELL